MKTQKQKSDEFQQLHRMGQCFVIPNPWDPGSARLLEHLGFKALASTGAGYAFSQGKPDLKVGAAEMFQYLSRICAASTLPVSADLQNGFGEAPEAVAASILAAAKTGVVGGSIEDAAGDAGNTIYEIGLATERIRQAVAAAGSLDFKFMLTARAENYFYGRRDLKDTIRRLQAYQEAGADVLYAPGVCEKADIRSILDSIDRPLNVLMGTAKDRLSLDELAEMGVTRVSVGGSLARAAYGALISACQEIKTSGRFGYGKDCISGREINGIFARSIADDGVAPE